METYICDHIGRNLRFKLNSLILKIYETRTRLKLLNRRTNMAGHGLVQNLILQATLPLSPQRDSTANAAPTPQAGSMESGSQVSLENGDWVYFACSNDMGLVAVF